MVELDASWVTANEVLVRSSTSVTIFVLVALAEIIIPRRALEIGRVLRWASNLALAVLNALIIRLLFPIAAVGTAAFASANEWGILNRWDVSFGVTLVASILILDFVIWVQHRAFHAIPALWRVHRVHHADPDYDLTTGLRFHPIEISISMLIKMLVIVAIGAPITAVVLFEVLLNATSTFNHGNVRIGFGFDRILRWVIVTPDMHRVHHSVDQIETNSNFGFNVPWWDRLFGTYRDQPVTGHEAMVVGVAGFDDIRDVCHLPGVLTMPFRRPRGQDRGSNEG